MTLQSYYQIGLRKLNNGVNGLRLVVRAMVQQILFRSHVVAKLKM